jgi:hypothetical protein
MLLATGAAQAAQVEPGSLLHIGLSGRMWWKR